MRRSLRVTRLWRETASILGAELRAPDGTTLPAFDAGAHISLHLPNGLTRQYSLANDPTERDRYVLGILHEPNGRGGSRWIHENLGEGMDLEVSDPLNNFAIRDGAERFLLIAGGVGITPILSMIERHRALNNDYHLYFCTRTSRDVAFRDRIDLSGFQGNVTYHHDGGDPAKGLNVRELLETHRAGTHLYCCGPGGLMTAVENASAHWPAGTTYFERFAGDVDAGAEAAPFTAVISSTGQKIHVSSDTSLLDELNKHGFDIEYACKEGVCGTCFVDVLEGEIDHRDVILDEGERASNTFMASCCSRAKSGKLVLDL